MLVVKNFTGFSDDELVCLWHRTNCGIEAFKETYVKITGYKDYNEDYVDLVSLWGSIRDELDKRNVDPHRCFNSKTFPLPDGYTAEIQPDGGVKAGCLIISRQVIKEINDASEKAYLS